MKQAHTMLVLIPYAQKLARSFNPFKPSLLFVGHRQTYPSVYKVVLQHLIINETNILDVWTIELS